MLYPYTHHTPPEHNMPYNPTIHNRHSIRFQGYDYSQAGAYYVTINTHKKDHLFGEVVGGVVILSQVGEIVQEQWLQIPTHFSNVVLDAFVIMPNHMHGIVVIMEEEVYTGKGKAFNPEFAISGLNALPLLWRCTIISPWQKYRSNTSVRNVGASPRV